jgi:hypothetical protein
MLQMPLPHTTLKCCYTEKHGVLDMPPASSGCLLCCQATINCVVLSPNSRSSQSATSCSELRRVDI